jgi:hypothetical protein
MSSILHLRKWAKWSQGLIYAQKAFFTTKDQNLQNLAVFRNTISFIKAKNISQIGFTDIINCNALQFS